MNDDALTKAIEWLDRSFEEEESALKQTCVQRAIAYALIDIAKHLRPVFVLRRTS